MQTRRVGRTNDIAVRVNAYTKREIGIVQKDIKDIKSAQVHMQKDIEQVQDHMSVQISELKNLMQQVRAR